jgi:predicted kinase
MEAVIFIGLQASGKTTFYRERFFETHLRLSLDMLHTRRRLMRLLETCIETRQPFVLDNTNATAAERAPYIEAARAGGFRVTGYYFRSTVADCLRRNQQREETRRVPPKGIFGTLKRLQPPAYAEGFDELHVVRINDEGEFVVEPWTDEV